MKIIVGCKLVPEEQDIVVQADGSLDVSRATPKISPFDLNAIEAAVEVKGLVGEAHITALSVGDKTLENSKARKDILSRGPDAMTAVMDDAYTHLLPEQTAEVMATAAREIGFDLILCGDGSGDLLAQQVGTRLGALLDVATLSGVSKIVSADNGKLVVERALESEVEVLEVTLPAVISVSADINTPAIPGMKAILAAGKKPVGTMTPAALFVEKGIAQGTASVELLETKAPKQKERLNVMIEGDGEDQIAELVSHLRKILN
ncbi:putative electron transfer flavoprotein FixA [Endozoicomonas atrinae]|uniref:putative electron transfer flavoprotein FixA n=1 Tax=Endozoicomonas atrinae TaxID=1333660 RepID=UPI003B00FB0D